MNRYEVQLNTEPSQSKQVVRVEADNSFYEDPFLVFVDDKHNRVAMFHARSVNHVIQRSAEWRLNVGEIVLTATGPVDFTGDSFAKWSR